MPIGEDENVVVFRMAMARMATAEEHRIPEGQVPSAEESRKAVAVRRKVTGMVTAQGILAPAFVPCTQVVALK